MKQRFTLLSLALVLSMFFCLSASAYDVEVDGRESLLIVKT